MNGHCICRNGFEGEFCNVVSYVPDKTNYTKMLKYLLIFIIMVILIVGLIFGAKLLFDNAGSIREKLEAAWPRPAPAQQPPV